MSLLIDSIDWFGKFPIEFGVFGFYLSTRTRMEKTMIRGGGSGEFFFGKAQLIKKICPKYMILGTSGNILE